jgi:hypothetical protein
MVTTDDATPNAAPQPAAQQNSQLPPGVTPLSQEDKDIAAGKLAPGFTPLDEVHQKAAGPDKLPPGVSPLSQEDKDIVAGNHLPAGFTPLSKEHSDAFDKAESYISPRVPPAAATQPKGTLAKAWDWVVKTPVLDNILPEGIKTSDLVRGAAFEKMFHEPYIPGVNDFDTKAQQHLGDSPTKAAVKTFIAGTAKDTSDLGAGMTTPLGIATIGAGVAAKAAPAIGVLADEAKLLQGAGSAVYAGQGAHDVVTSHPDIHYEGITERPETLGFSANPDEAQKGLGGLAGVTGGVAGVHDALPEGTGRWTVDKLGKAIGKTDDAATAFQRMMKVTPKAAPETVNLIKTALPDLQAIINDDPKKLLNSPTKIADKLDDQIQSHHDELLKKAGETQDSRDPVVPDLNERLTKRFADYRKANKGLYTEEELDQAQGKLLNKIMQKDDAVEGERLPNLFEADNIRRGFNRESQTQMGAPRNAYQAMANEAQDVMRNAVYDGFEAKGIDNVDVVRKQDAALIDLRDKLYDAQGKFDAAGKGGVLRALFHGVGSGPGTLAILLGHPIAGAPFLAGGLLADLIHTNATNPASNLGRFRTLAAREPNAVTTELEHTTPTPGASTPGSTATGSPTGGPTPTTPPPAPPPINHAQYAELATLKGETLDPANYPKLESDFEEYLAKKRASGKPITPEDRATLREFNKHKANNLAAHDQYAADLAAHQTAQLTAREAEIQQAIKAAQTETATSAATPAPGGAQNPK